ncbi:hypothetical protein HY345_01465 [Candidatus Microgenomates bacterium]|nr:hypothetical protein [Candidatus Microgenomates bacterium]
MLVGALFFGLGTFLGALKTVKSKDSWRMFMMSLFIALSALLPYKHEVGYNIFSHITFYYILFVFFFTLLTAKESLAHISEGSILKYHLLFWYIFLLNANTATNDFLSIWNYSVFLLAIPASALILFISFSKRANSTATEVLVYLWFVLINISLIIFQYQAGLLSFDWQHTPASLFGMLIFIINGLIFFQLISNCAVIYSLLPIPGKHQSFQSKLKQIKEFISILTEKVSDKQVETGETVFILTLEGGLLFLNYIYRWFPDFWLINLCLILSSTVFLNVLKKIRNIVSLF